MKIKTHCIAVALLTGSLATFVAAEDSKAREAWMSVRANCKLHLQALAVSEDLETVIVCEPPPHATMDAMSAILGAQRAGEVHTTIGHDGWVSDVVFELSAIDRSILQERLASLALFLYGTTFGVDYIQLPTTVPMVTHVESVDVSVSPDDLYRWLIEERILLKSSLNGLATTAPDLLVREVSDVCRSEPLGLSIWAFPRSDDLSQYRAECRRWAIESDLVLGGVANANTVLVVGRTRQAGLDELPPLRVEEVMRLAAATTRELAQSYERNHFLAGRCDAFPHHDWAPIFLSPELLDCEYGSLLNVTDQLLKSWSEAGNVRYENFQYPDPVLWPFLNAISDLAPGDSLTYNWNTTGSGHSADYADGVQVFAVLRTGALPVSYIPGGIDVEEEVELARKINSEMAQYEEVAYNYFASSGNPHLARVVQYVALYQLFRLVEARCTGQLLVAIPEDGDRLFSQMLQRAIDRLVAMDEDELDRITAEAGMRWAEQLEPDPAAREAVASQVELTVYVQAIGLRSALSEFTSTFGTDFVAKLAHVIANPRRLEPELEEYTKIAEALGNEAISIDSAPRSVQAAVRRLAIASALSSGEFGLLQHLLISLAGAEQINEDYAAAFQGARSNAVWIRTPSIVQSHDRANPTSIGGHNLDSAVVEFRIDPAASRGSPAVATDGDLIEVRIHPDDAAGLAMTGRRLARSSDPASEAADIVRNAAIEWSKLPRDMTKRLQVAEAGSGTGGPPHPPTRISLGSFSADPPNNREFFDSDSAATGPRIGPGGYLSFTGADFLRASTGTAAADLIVGAYKQRATPTGTAIRIRVHRDALNPGQFAAFTAHLRARLPRSANVIIERGRGSSLFSVDLRGSRVRTTTTESSIVGPVVSVVIEPPNRPNFFVRAFTKRSAETIEPAVRHSIEATSPTPLTPVGLKIRLDQIEGLEDVNWLIELPGDTPTDDINISNSTDWRLVGDTWTRAA
jgi:hypothetical protein